MQRGGRWYTSDNRRLWIFRELERLGKCKEIAVKLAYVPEHKFTTHNRGESVRVRGIAGGKWYLRSATSSQKRSTSSYETRSAAPISSSAYRQSNDPMANYFNRMSQPRSALKRTTPTYEMQSTQAVNRFYHQTDARPRTASIYDARSVSPQKSFSHRFCQDEPRSTGLFSFQQEHGPSSRESSIRSFESERTLFTSNNRNDSRHTPVTTTVTESQRILRGLSSLRISNYPTVKHVDPMDCRFLKHSIPRYFDNGRSSKMLTRQLMFGQLSYRDIPPVKAYEAFGAYYVRDGNRRLKAMKEVREVINDTKIKVEIIGDKNDLLDGLRKKDLAQQCIKWFSLENG